MKRLLFFILILNTINSYSQLSSNSGGNIYLCSTFDSFELAPMSINRLNSILGGNPTATGGVPPYKYKWDCLVKTTLTSKPYIYASDLLNDTTIANPKLKFKYGLKDAFISNKPIIFKLTVLDNIGNISKDSLIIMQSSFIYSMISSIGKRIEDTTILPNVAGGGINPCKTIWTPTTYLIDTNKAGTRTYTKNEITYNGYRVDSIGCKSATFDLQIYLIVSSILNSSSINFIKNYHNPIYEYSIFELSNINNISYIEIYNIEGQKIHSQKSTDKLEIGRLIEEKGIYFIVFYDIDNKMKSIKIQKE
ncbi:MAG: T9SS type A sorting domain-containing protein [Flavobacterium sp.]